jgi:hypothetical protein
VTVFVCYYDNGLYDGYSMPICVFLTEQEAKAWVKEENVGVNYSPDYVEIEVG